MAKTFMTIEQAVAQFPQLSNTGRGPMTSKHFDVIPTDSLLERLDGWQVQSVTVQKPRDPELARFAPHTVRLVNDTVVVKDKTFVTVEITNSAMGHHKLSATTGLWRFWCENGASMPVFMCQPVEFAHRNIEQQQVIDIESRVIDTAERLDMMIGDWSARELNEAQALEYARQALILRWQEHAPIGANDLLTVRREADSADDLWHVYNRVQEGLVRGGQAGQASSGRRVTVRGIDNLAQNEALNQSLLTLTSEYALTLN